MVKNTAQQAPPIKASFVMDRHVHDEAVIQAKKEKRSLAAWLAVTVEEKLHKLRGKAA